MTDLEFKKVDDYLDNEGTDRLKTHGFTVDDVDLETYIFSMDLDDAGVANITFTNYRNEEWSSVKYPKEYVTIVGIIDDFNMDEDPKQFFGETAYNYTEFEKYFNKLIDYLEN